MADNDGQPHFGGGEMVMAHDKSGADISKPNLRRRLPRLRRAVRGHGHRLTDGVGRGLGRARNPVTTIQVTPNFAVSNRENPRNTDVQFHDQSDVTIRDQSQSRR